MQLLLLSLIYLYQIQECYFKISDVAKLITSVYHDNNILKCVYDFDPGDLVINPLNREWGIGQVQSIVEDKVTVNFQNVGKKTINTQVIVLERYNDEN